MDYTDQWYAHLSLRNTVTSGRRCCLLVCASEFGDLISVYQCQIMDICACLEDLTIVSPSHVITPEIIVSWQEKLQRTIFSGCCLSQATCWVRVLMDRWNFLFAGGGCIVNGLIDSVTSFLGQQFRDLWKRWSTYDTLSVFHCFLVLFYTYCFCHKMGLMFHSLPTLNFFWCNIPMLTWHYDIFSKVIKLIRKVCIPSFKKNM